VPAQDDRTSWGASQFGQWIDLEMAVPLRIDHGPLIDSRGVISNLGRAAYFAVIKEPVFGMLCRPACSYGRGQH
jgi:hypothetical protein